MSRLRKQPLDQPWLPGIQKCFWQEGAGKRWFPAVVMKDLGDTFLEVEVTGMGRRIGTMDRTREYPGRVRLPPRTRRTRRDIAPPA